ncbi:MAG: hypothetical protein RLZZ440_2706 [Planctomycetota bacterium]
MRFYRLRGHPWPAKPCLASARPAAFRAADGVRSARGSSPVCADGSRGGAARMARCARLRLAACRWGAESSRGGAARMARCSRLRPAACRWELKAEVGLPGGIAACLRERRNRRWGWQASWPVGAGLQPARIRTYSASGPRHQTQRPHSAGCKPAATGLFAKRLQRRRKQPSNDSDNADTANPALANASKTANAGRGCPCPRGGLENKRSPEGESAVLSE